MRPPCARAQVPPACARASPTCLRTPLTHLCAHAPKPATTPPHVCTSPRLLRLSLPSPPIPGHLHRAVHRGCQQPAQQPAPGRSRGGSAQQPRQQGRHLLAQGQVHVQRRGTAARRPAHRWVHARCRRAVCTGPDPWPLHPPAHIAACACMPRALPPAPSRKQGTLPPTPC